jgi:hypothetical protein
MSTIRIQETLPVDAVEVKPRPLAGSHTPAGRDRGGLRPWFGSGIRVTVTIRVDRRRSTETQARTHGMLAPRHTSNDPELKACS